MITARSHVRTQITWLAVMDLTCLVLGSIIGVVLRFGHQEMIEYVFRHLEGWILLFGGVMLGNYLGGTYQLQYTYSRFNLVVTWLFSLGFALLILSITSYSWFIFILGRGVLFLSLASYSLISLFLKLLVYRSLFRSESFTCRTVVLGTGDRAMESVRLLESPHVLPAHKVVACVRVIDSRESYTPHASVAHGIAVMESTPEELPDVVRSLDVRLIVEATDDPAEVKKLYPKLRKLRFRGVERLSRLALCEAYSGRTPLDLVDEEFLTQVSLESGLPLVWRLKRLFDILFSLIACVLLLPVFVLVAFLLKLTAPFSPVLYSQKRVGQFGRVFRIHKLRTMREDAEKGTGPVWSQPGDPRVTRLGRVLRRFRIDEIPQFLNILKGEMSLVGPRPERPEINAELARKIPYYEERENVMPGLTGWAQIRHPYGSTIEDSMRKLEYDLFYIKHLSISLDVQIILSTLRIVVMGREFKV